MERLTHKDGANRNIVEVKKFSNEGWVISEMSDGITIKFHSKAIDKLAEFEDFMDEYEIEDLKMAFENLTDTIKQNKLNYEELHKYKNKLVIENQALKDRWKELKEFVIDELRVDRENFKLTKSSMCDYFCVADQTVLDKMQELEKE